MRGKTPNRYKFTEKVVDASDAPPHTAEAQTESVRIVATAILTDALHNALDHSADRAEGAAIRRLLARFETTSSKKEKKK